MTKITITIDGKTYTTSAKEFQIRKWFDLVELQQEEKTEQSILQKLRAEIERKIKVVKGMQFISHGSYVNGRLFELNDLRDYLNELEKDEEGVRKWMDEHSECVKESNCSEISNSSEEPIEKVVTVPMLHSFEEWSYESGTEFEMIVLHQLRDLTKVCQYLLKK